MASVVQICNMALAHVGASSLVESIDPPDGSVNADHCARFYSHARTVLLEPGNWAFSLTRVELAQVTNDSTQWTYAYAKPSGCLRALRVIHPYANITVFNQDDIEAQSDDRSSAAFDLEGEVLFTNETDAVLVYVQDITDTTKWPASFVDAVGYMLASYIAGPIVKGVEGIKLGQALREQAMRIADVSATASANASHAEGVLESSIQSARR
jgi:hypothetical protein